ncbi:putative leucine-rich repeat-containing protein DDB_G0290503 [Vanessa atalanta]|uniref:putative leucine-rich repeat-containing protein DDB_G0290503 n=1 Tax=Vanessa atalanta TaxID=42275 RepID=UPI001FCD6819|nr:putative leucine-rich repeat-containing protein DDB_G0290503 [Vanessa atalanta]
MEGPGMSLFQGAASIHINNSAQDRLEEQEELEDQKRRNEELQQNLDNAFDDLQVDDDNSSVNSSGNYTLDATRANGVHHPARTGLPPTYVESLNHLKETQHGSDSPKHFHETPKNNLQHLRGHEDVMKCAYSPYGAGDGQNHYFNQDVRGHLNGINSYDARQEFMSNEQLKFLYEMRVKECEQYATQIEVLDNETDSLRAKLLAAVHDKDKAQSSLQEAHHLLASSKHKSMELEQQMIALREQMQQGEHDKEQLRLELRAADSALRDAQQRLHTLQVAHSHDTDALFREQQDRHREEMDRLHNDLMKAKSRLDEKDNEVKLLEKRCMERDREKEEILIEKGATINRLASELEAAQSRLVSGESARLKEKVLQLTSERNAAREQVKELGSKLEVTAQELVMCRNKVLTSQREYENWKTTLNQILTEILPDNNYNIADPPSPGKLANLKEVLNRYKQQAQKLSTLQEELAKREKRLEQHRKQESDLRAKLEEQKGIEMQLNSRLAVLQNKLELLGTNSDSELVETYKQQNEHMRKDAEDLRAEIKTLELKYTELEMDYEKLKNEKGSRASLVQEANADLLRELERYNGQLKDTLKENGELKTLYLQVCSARDAVTRELKNVHTKTQREIEQYKSQEREYVERIENEKRQVEKLTIDLSNCREELERANRRISELQKEFTDKQKEFTDKLDKFIEDEKTAMRKEMAACAQCEKQLKHIRNLEDQLSKRNLKLAAQESNETLMKELKGKAQFFQKYIVERYKKLSDLRSVATNTDNDEASPVTSPARATRHDDDDDNDHDRDDDHHDDHDHQAELMMKEKAIRDQIAEKFTLEIKTIEMNCARRLKEMETEQMTAVTKLKDLLERKATEVDTLKQFILSERAKVTQILESKENEISILIKEHNELQNECQKAKDDIGEWRHKAEKYKDRLSRLGSLEDIIKKEKEDWKQKSNSNAKEFHTMRTKLLELQANMSQLEEKYAKVQSDYQILQEKYKNAKRTVLTYKDYMAKKDTHINNEMNRIQDEYRKIFVKLQNQINYYVNCRVLEEKKHKEKRPQSQQQVQVDYTEKLNELTEDFARLAQSNFKDSPDLH